MVTPVADGVVTFLRGAVWCAVTEADSVRLLSGEQALTWVDQIIPGTFERLAIGSSAGQAVRADPLSDLRDGVVPGQGFVLTRLAAASGPEPAASGPEPAASTAGSRSSSGSRPGPGRSGSGRPSPTDHPGRDGLALRACRRGPGRPSHRAGAGQSPGPVRPPPR